MKKIIFILFFLLIGIDVYAEKISLESCESAALEKSNILTPYEKEFLAAKSAQGATKSLLFPSLFLEGNFKYIQTVPELETNIPQIGTIKMGDNINYSAGAVLYWTIFDGNARFKNYQAYAKITQSKNAQYETAKKNLILNVRSTYFQLINSVSVLNLAKEQLNLSLEQNADIKKMFGAGTKSKLDEIMSGVDVLMKRKNIVQAQNAVLECVKELNSLTGDIIKIDDDIFSKSLEFDLASELIEKFSNNLEIKFDEQNPEILSLDFLASYYELLSKSIKNSAYPRINVFAKSSYDYPNGFVKEEFNQNSAGANFSMPLFEFSANKKSATSNKFISESNQEKRKILSLNLERLFVMTKIKTRNLLSQQNLNLEIIKGTKTAATMIYKSYLAGNVKFLDVQNINMLVLQAQTEANNCDMQILIELAILEVLGK